MSQQRFLEALNFISDLFVFELSPADRKDIPISFREDEEDPIFVARRSQFKLNSAVTELLDFMPRIRGTISEGSLLSKLIPAIRQKKKAGKRFNAEDEKLLRKSLEELPIRKFKIVKRLYGVTMSSDCGEIVIGDYTIDFGRRIFGAARESALSHLALKPKDDVEVFIQVEVHARDAETANKLADSLFYGFEQIFRLLIGVRTTWVEVGIVNYTGPQMRDRFCLEGDQLTGHGSSWEGALQPFILNDPRFPMPDGPMLRLFELITRSQNDFERHIVRAAEWVGQAIAELNEASALVKAATALEVLFSTNEKGLITPSIMAQIAESCALLLGSSTTPPVEIEKTVKHLYGERSAVVHSGRNTVKSSDLNTFISICRQLILLLVSKPEYSSMKSMEELKGYLKNKKYSSCS
jgi:hypothetical protein